MGTVGKTDSAPLSMERAADIIGAYVRRENAPLADRVGALISTGNPKEVIVGLNIASSHRLGAVELGPYKQGAVAAVDLLADNGLFQYAARVIDTWKLSPLDVARTRPKAAQEVGGLVEKVLHSAGSGTVSSVGPEVETLSNLLADFSLDPAPAEAAKQAALWHIVTWADTGETGKASKAAAAFGFSDGELSQALERRRKEHRAARE